MMQYQSIKLNIHIIMLFRMMQYLVKACLFLCSHDPEARLCISDVIFVVFVE